MWSSGEAEAKFARGRNLQTFPLHPKLASVANISDYMLVLFYKMTFKIHPLSYIHELTTQISLPPNTLIHFGSHLPKNPTYSLIHCSIINSIQ